MYYSSGNYEAFARPKKPEGVDNRVICPAARATATSLKTSAM